MRLFKRGLCIGFSLTLLSIGVIQPHLKPMAYAQEETPNPFPMTATGMVTTDNALRYSVLIPKPILSSDDFTVQIEVSGESEVVEIFQAGGSPFAGIVTGEGTQSSDKLLVWTAAENRAVDSPDSPIETFSFTLDAPVEKPLLVTASWGGENAGELSQEVYPRYAYHFSGVGQITLTKDTPPGFQRIGATGIQISASGEIATDTTITARALPPESNPSAETGDYWWCSVLELSEIAAGESVIVQMPLRRPLPPGTPVVLFQQQADGGWLPLDNPGVVTADGQAVEYEHPGGVVATGVEKSLQPQFAEPLPLSVEQLADLLPNSVETTSQTTIELRAFSGLPAYIQEAFVAAENLDTALVNFSAAWAENDYVAQCGVAANGESVCSYWIEVGYCTVSVQGIPGGVAVPGVTCSNSTPPEGYESVCLFGEGVCQASNLASVENRLKTNSGLSAQ